MTLHIEGLTDKQVRNLLFWCAGGAVITGATTYEYFDHLSLVPITNRRHCIVLTISGKLYYQFLTKKHEIQYQPHALKRKDYKENLKVCRSVCEKNDGKNGVESGMKEVCEIVNEIDSKRIITNPKDKRVIMVKKIVDRLCEACKYFEPGSEDFYDNFKIFIVEDPEVNAYAALGGYIIINTGLIDHYLNHEKAKRCKSAEHVRKGVDGL